MKALGIGEFKRLVMMGRAPAGAVVRMAAAVRSKALEDEDRTVEFILSTDSVDRDQDSIDQNGWKLAAYKKNPVVQWGHDYRLLPVGRAKNIRVENGKLMAKCEFTPKGMHPFNDTVFEMTKAGFLNACSVGFRPIKYEWPAPTERRPRGIDFREVELLEWSIVPVPANAEALIQGRGGHAPRIEQRQRELDDLLHRPALVRARRALARIRA